ncbi:unnamed protein product [Anisakis simplex]|uniref:Phosphoinositide 3-kinase adapter subunit (inferred by orthology to a C. elegans protein) n=1 Tax=Anisakis simplex TaxID=6269 RepID=A0A0M3JV69_ANISI|nr:unnamed protein product [Anisakis simplex]
MEEGCSYDHLPPQDNTHRSPSAQKSSSVNNNDENDESKRCALDLSSQLWYWGDTSKDLIASAMNGCDSGTYCVRDASTKGDYTLTLRFGDRNKLIKIFVSNGRCGFAMEDLRFATVVELVDYYKRNSLAEYNRQLETELLYPLRRPNIEKTMWEIDGVHSVEHLLCQLRGLRAAHSRILRLDDQINAELETNKTLLTNESELAHLNVNIEFQQRRSESIQIQQEQMNQQVKVIEARIEELNLSRSKLRPKLSNLYADVNNCEYRLCQLKVPQSTLDKERQEVSFLLDAEPEPLSHILMQLHIKWQPDRFLSTDCSKENGMKIVRALMDCNPNNSNGIFVIRRSGSQAGHYALTISNDNQIYNCLIEHRDVKHPESCGYAFRNTKLFFATLVDFVRYYSHCSMKEHNSQLNTRLEIPAFKGTL